MNGSFITHPVTWHLNWTVSNPAGLRQNHAQLQTIACRFEEQAEKMFAHLPLTGLEQFL